MAITAAVFLQRAADFVHFDWTVGAAAGSASVELGIRKFINNCNTAIRWAHKEFDPAFAWPFDVTASAGVTVTSDKIAAASLGEASWCAVFSADPRVISNQAYPIRCYGDTDGGAILEKSSLPYGVSPATVFVFYRSTTPQITYAAGGAYSTPTLPDQLIHPILLYLRSIIVGTLHAPQLEGSNDNEATQILERRRNALYDSKLIWISNGTAL